MYSFFLNLIVENLLPNLSGDILDMKDRDIDKGHKNVKGNISDN